MAGCSCLSGKNTFSLLFNAQWKFLTLCSFCSPLLLPSPASSLAVILLFVSENPRAIRSDIPPPCPPLPHHAHAHLHPVPHPQQRHAHPAGASGPVRQQARLFLQLLILFPSLLRRFLPSLLAQLPTFPLQLCEPHLPPLLPSTLAAALVALARSATTHPLTFLPGHGGSSDQLGLRSYPGVRGHGVAGHGASVCPLPFASPLASADHGEPACQQ